MGHRRLFHQHLFAFVGAPGPRCLGAPDTLFHRWLTCPHIESKAIDSLGIYLFSQIVARGPECALAVRGLVPMPKVSNPPVKSPGVQFINFGPDDCFDPRDGDVFLDGSCLHSNTKQLARAGFAACQINNFGDVVKAVWGAVPSRLPQTSLCGEFAALWAIVEVGKGVNAVIDCANVISSWHRGPPAMVNSFTPHACTFKYMLGIHPLEGRVGSVQKIKAHHNLEDVPDTERDFFLRRGNDAADSLAKQGAALHPLDPVHVADLKRVQSDVINPANHVIDTMSSFDFVAPHRLPLLPRHASLRRIRGHRVEGHDFIWQGRFLEMPVLSVMYSSPLPGPILWSPSLAQGSPRCPGLSGTTTGINFM